MVVVAEESYLDLMVEGQHLSMHLVCCGKLSFERSDSIKGIGDYRFVELRRCFRLIREFGMLKLMDQILQHLMAEDSVLSGEEDREVQYYDLDNTERIRLRRDLHGHRGSKVDRLLESKV